MTVFMHIDMDAFFAAIEERDHPEWHGAPIIVGSDPKEGKGRGVVSTASYAAREFGVGSAMPISQAWKRCPHGVYVRPRMARYADVSTKVMEIFRSFTPLIQPISLDEAFLDVTGSIRLFGEPREMGQKIKQRVFDVTGLTCSVGISRVKSVAKIASDMEKPDGLTLVPDNEEKAFLAPLEVRRLWGIGPKAAAVLARSKIHHVADIQKKTVKTMIRICGKAAGVHYWNMANAVDPREVHDDEKALSISHETTFIADVQDRETLLRTLLWLSDKVASRLRKHAVSGRVVTMKYRTEDFKTFTRRVTLPSHVLDTNQLFDTGKKLLKDLRKKKGRVRLLGIGVSGLESSGGVQLDLFDDAKRGQSRATDAAVDEVRKRFGKDAITRGSLLRSQEDKDKKKSEDRR